MNDKELLKKLRDVFLQEAKERFTSISSNLIGVEQSSDESIKKGLLEIVYRDIHSLKGASRSINLNHIEAFFQYLENFFNELKTGTRKLSSELQAVILDITVEMSDILDKKGIEELDTDTMANSFKERIAHIVRVKETDGQKDKGAEVHKHREKTNIQHPTPNVQRPTSNIQRPSDNRGPGKAKKEDENFNLGNVHAQPNVETLHLTSQNNTKSVITTAPAPKPETTVPRTNISSANDTVRISSSKLDSILLRSENLIRIKQMFLENISTLDNKLLSLLSMLTDRHNKVEQDMIGMKQQLQEDKAESSEIIVPLHLIKKIVAYSEELGLGLKELSYMSRQLANTNKENHRNSDKLIDGFLSDIKEMAMLPFSNILDVFPRMIRDISKELGKDINFHISGDDIKIDRRILQEIKDPLIHVIRNSIDHGIEEPGVRKSLNKAEKGDIKLSILQNESSKVEIVVEDDGHGIDIAKIRKKLVERDIVDEETAIKMSDEAVREYMFHSGFSTKDIITDISGRGLGLTIVRDKLANLGGKILIESTPEIGTRFRLILPVTLATFKGILVKSNDRKFIIPSISVEKVVRLEKNAMKRIENKNAIVYLDTTYSLVEMSGILNIPAPAADNEKEKDLYVTAVILCNENKLLALRIDDIFEEQEILIKDLGKQLGKVQNISGATVLNSGEIVPILNIKDIFDNSASIRAGAGITAQKPEAKTTGKTKPKSSRKNILVVEDSITSRILIKNILEAAGYAVDTAIDGLAGFTALKSGNFDLVVSDIEMPRMDGFELTTKIRADQKYAALPLILVTSRSSDADKERGISVGANAYIMKSQFDQSNLLDTIRNLL